MYCSDMINHPNIYVSLKVPTRFRMVDKRQVICFVFFIHLFPWLIDLYTLMNLIIYQSIKNWKLAIYCWIHLCNKLFTWNTGITNSKVICKVSWTSLLLIHIRVWNYKVALMSSWTFNIHNTDYIRGTSKVSIVPLYTPPNIHTSILSLIYNDNFISSTCCIKCLHVTVILWSWNNIIYMRCKWHT